VPNTDTCTQCVCLSPEKKKTNKLAKKPSYTEKTLQADPEIGTNLIGQKIPP